MKPCPSQKLLQPAAEPAQGPAAVPLSVGHIGAGWPALALDDFGILGTHYLPTDWIGGGEVNRNSLALSL